ncbi:YadA-like family protein [Cobetia amphilecti]|nr:YadA-like family protein [Cobetia amphilecti]UBU50457.1 YadA-like family protein [Cobetia amphilecti]
MAVGTGSRASGVSAQASGTRASASGANAQASGTDANASGVDTQASGTRAQASGSNAQASGTDARASGTDAQASGTRASASGSNAIASGTDARGYASDGIAMGTGAQAGFDDPNNLDPLRNSGGIAIGNETRADEEHALALGVEAQARAQSATAIGDGAEASDTAQGGLAVGAGAGVTAQNAAAFGQSAKAEGIEALAMGSGARAEAQSATAIGAGALANHQGSVALGSNAVTAAPVSTDEMTVDKNTYDFAGTSPVATVSVGGLGEERTLTNVAAGRVSAASTDAVNGSQLYGTNQAVDALADNLDTAGGSVAAVMGGNAAYDPQTHQVTMNNVGGTGEDTLNDAIEYAAQGWDVTANNDAGANVAPGDSVDFSSTDSNIAISRAGTDLVFNLAEDIGVDGSVSVGSDTVVDGDSVTTNNLTVGGDTFVVAGDTVTYDGNEIATQADGLSFAGNTGGAIDKTLGDTTPLTVSGGLALGEASSGANLRVDSDGNQLNLVMARNLTELDSVTTGNSVLDTGGLTVNDGTNSTEYGTAGMTITGGPSVTSGGIDAGDQVIASVADGDVNATSSDAINGSQLQAAGDSLASNVLGGDAAYADNDFTMSDVGGTGENTIDEAIASANTAANAGWDISAQGSNSTNVGPNDSVDLNNSDGNIVVSKTATDNDVTFDLAANLTADSVTTGNSVLDTDGLTVDDGAGNVTEVTTAGISVSDGTDSTAYGADGMTIAGGPSVTSGGIDAAGNTVTGVADGAINSTSSEAINGSQLQAAGDSLASNVLGGNADYTGNDFTMSDVGGTGENTIDEAIASANTAANAGWDISAQGSNSTNVGPNDSVDLNNSDGNIVVSKTATDNDVTFDLAANLTADSVTTGNSVLDTDGLTVDDGAGNVTEVTTAGISVSDGTDSTEYGADGMAIAGGPSVTSGGIDAAGNTITGVADGAINSTSSDAINGSQLQAAGDSLASNVLGGNADYTGNDFTMSDVGGTGENTIDEAIASANTAANAGWDISAQGSNSTNVGPNDSVDLNNSDGNIEVSKTITDNDVTFDLADDIDVASVTADDGAGNVTAVTATGTSVTDGTASTAYGAAGMTIAGGPSVTSGGIDAGDQVIANVADGDINASSGDAINGSQLQAAGGSLASSVLGGDAAYDDNDFTMSDVGGTGENTIDEAIASANTAANAGWNVADTNGNSHNIGPNGKVTFDGDSNVTVTESGADDDAKVQVALNDDITVDSVAADSVTTGNSTLDTNGLTVDDGAGNVTEVAATGTSVTDGINSTAYGADGMTIAGGPSVTSGGIDAAGNTITGVADGAINSTSSEAINGSQLQAAGDSLASSVLGGDAAYADNDFTMSDVGGTGENTIDEAIASANTAANAGWDISAQGSNSTNVGPNDSVDLNNSDGNIVVSKTATVNDVTFDLAANLTADSVTTGNSVLDTDGLTVDDGAGNVAEVTTAGTSVSDGTDSTGYGADGMTIAGGPSVTSGGIDAAGNTVTGVGDGAINSTSSDAINGSQLQAAGDSLASNVLGGDAAYADNDFTMSDVGGTGENTIDEAIASANTAANAGWDISAQGSNSTNVGPNDSVDLNNSDGNIVVSKTATDNDVTFDLAANLTADSVTTGNSVLDTDGLTVDDGAGNGTDSTAYGADGMTIASGPSVTSGGIDAAGNTITGVADGAINSTSSEAINGSQLQAAGDSLASSVLGGDAAYADNDFTMSDVGGTGENTIDEAIASANTAANAGWNVADTNGNSHNIGPNGKVTFDGDSNVTVTESGADDDAKVQVALNDDITVDSVAADSVTTGNSTLDTNGLTVDDGAGNVTEVAATGTSVTDGINSTAYGADGMTIAGGPSVTSGGIDAAGNTITGVADGAINSTSSEAINGSQLQAAGDSLASSVLGGDAAYADNDFTMSDVGGTGENTIDEAIASANTAANAGWNVADTNGNSHNIGPNGKVTFDGDSNVTVTESGADDDAKVQVALNDDITVDSVAADSVTTGNSTLDTNGLTVDDGAGNVTEVAATGTSVTDGINSTAYGADGMTIAGGPSVTSGGIDAAGNTITGVADGAINSASSDAINGSQLQAAGDSLASNVLGGNADYTGNNFTMSDVGGTGESTIDDAIRSANTAANAGWNVADTNGNSHNIGPNGKVTFDGDSNVTVTESGADDDAKVQVALNDDITVDSVAADSVTTGNSTLDTNGLTVDDGAGNVTEVAATGTSVTDGINSTAYGAEGMAIAGGPSVTSGGINAAGNTITGVADGAINSISSDAINGSQLQAAGDSLASNVLGGNAAYADNDFTMSDVGGTGENTIDEAIASANTAANAGWDISAQGSNSTNVGPNDSVDLNNSDGNIVVSKTATDNDVTFDLAANLTADSVTTGNSVLDTDGLTVDDGAGNVAEVTTAGTSVSDGTDSTGYGADGMTIAGGPSVTSGGIDAAGNTITGVADGAINSTSSEAINGSQLQAAGDSLASSVLGGDAAYADNDFTMSDVGGTGENTIDEAIASANTAANAGWDISAQGSNSTNVGPNDSVDLNNSDGNIVVSKTATDNDVTFDLAANLTADSVTTGNSVLDTDGLTVDDGAGNVTEVSTAGISVSDGTDSTEYGADGMAIAGGPSVTSGGIDAAGNTVTGVADGAINSTSSDAINGSQLQAAGDSLASNVLGGDAAYADNDFTMSDVGGTGENTIDEAIASANTAANAGWDISAQGSNSTNVGPNDSVDLNNSDGNIVVSKTATDNDVTFDLAANLTADSVTTGNSVLDTDGLTVDDGAGNITEVTTAGTRVANGTNTTEYGADGMTIAGGPSVTTGGIDTAGNKVTNVADGDINASSGDAINGSQLQAAGDSLASNVLGGNADYTGNDFTMSDVGGTGEDTIDDAIKSANTAANAGWNVADTNGNSHNIGPNGKVTFDGDSNVTVTESGADDDAKVQVALNDDITVDSVTTGNSTLDNDGLTVDDGAGNVTAVTATGTSVTDGINSTAYGADGMTIAGGPSVTSGGIDAAGNTITGVADGAINSASSDAINGSQLQAAGDSLASNVLGGNADYTGNNFTMSDVGGTGESTIDDAIRSANTAANAGWNVADTNGNSHNIGPNGKVTFDGDSNVTVTESGADDDAKVQVALNDDITVDSVAADSVTTGNSTLDTNGLTVDDGAGNVTEVAATGTSVTDGINSTAYGADGMTIAGGPSVTSGGIDAAGNTITGVADGAINSTSSEAINGSQLQAAGDSLASSVLGGDAAYADNDFTMSDVGGTGENTIDEAIASANTAANAGWNVADTNGNSHNIGPNGKVTFDGDSNVTVTESGADDDAKVQVALNDDITVDSVAADSVTTGNSTLDTNGLTVDDGAGNVTEVAATGTSVTDGINSTAYGADGMTIAGGPSVTSGGIDAAGNTITGVADGAINSASGDAINGSQLQAAGDSLASNVLGGNADYTGNDFTMSDVGGTGEDTIDDAIKSANTAANAGWNVADTNGNIHNIGPNGKVTFDGDSNVTVTESGADDDAKVQVALNDDIAVDSVTTGNSTLDTDGLIVDDGINSTEYGADGMTIAGGPSVTTGGIDAAGNTVTGVADGAINSTSSDAINGSQLQAAGDSLASNVLGGDAAYTGNDFSMSDVGGTGESTIDDAIRSANTAANAGWNVADTNGNSHNIGPNGKVTFDGDSNVTVTESGADDDAKVQVALNDDIAVDSVTTGNSMLDTDGLTVDDGAGNVTEVTATGTSVTDGINSTAYGAEGMTIAGGPSVTTGGIDAAGNTVTGVADGAINSTSSDAINGSQLQAAGDSLASNVLGGNANYTGNDFSMSDVGGTGESTIDDAIRSANTAANAGWNVADINGNSHNIGPNGQVTFDGDSNVTVTESGADDDAKVQVALNDDIAVDSITTGNSTLDTDGLTLDDGTHSTKVSAGSINVAGGGNSITMDGGAGDITGLANIDLDGNDFAQAGRAATEEQLDLVNQTASAGWNLSGSDANQVNIGPNGAVDFQGDSNLSVVQSGQDDNGKIDITLNPDLDVDSVTAGDTSLDTEGLVVNDSTANPTATTSVEAGTITLAANPTTGSANEIVIDANSGTVGGLTNTTFDPDNFTSGQAATEDQLGQVYTVANAGWSVSVDGEGAQSDGSNNVGPGEVVDFTSEDGNVVINRDGTNLAFNLADSITLGDGETAINVDGEKGEIGVGDTLVNGGGVSVGDDVTLGDTGLEIAGGPSVTAGGINAGGSKITGVAAGNVSEISSDAINGSQLYDVQQIANAGWNLTGSGADEVNIGPEGAVDFQGDNNISVAQIGTDNAGVIQVALNDTLTLGEGDSVITVDGTEGSIATGDTIMNGDGVRVGDNVVLDESGLVITGGPSVTVSGINAGGIQITNVGSGLGGQSLDQISGDDLMNAVNVGDLQQVAGDIGDDVAAAKTEVTEGKNISVIESTGSDGQTIYEVATADEVEFDKMDIGSVTIDKDNVDRDGNTIIAGVGRGEVSADSTDVVNGSQLYDVKEEVGDINNSLDGGMDFAADEGDAVNRKLGDTVAITGDNNITTRTSDDGVQVTLNQELNVDSVAAGRTTVSDRGVTIEGGPSMTVDGIDGGGKRITNVAPGVEAGDAVNVGQMQELNRHYAQEFNNVHRRINEVEKSANAGTASALAASTVPQAWISGKSMVGVGAGTYGGESAISIGVSRLSDNGRFIIQGKVTGDSQSNFGAGIGAGWHW